MILLITGATGSGKTLNSLKQFILPALKKGRKIITNIDGLNHLAISYATGLNLIELQDNIQVINDINTEVIKKTPIGALIVVDEAQVIWSNRAYASKDNIELLPHLQKHRHYGQDLIFITQQIDQLDIGIRRLCHVHYRIARMSNVGLSGTCKVKVYPDAMGSEQFKPAYETVWKIDSSIFPMYSSYSDKDAIEQKSPLGNVIFKNTRLMFALIVLIISSILVYRQFFMNDTSMFAPTMSLYKLPDNWVEYYCAPDFFKVLNSEGKTLEINKAIVPPDYCPKLGYHQIKGEN